MRKLVYSFLIIGAVSLGGCTLPSMIKKAKEQNLTVTPNPLEVHKDTVNFDMAANLPVKMLKKGTVYTVNTFYKYGGNETALDPIPFKAEDYPNSSTEQPKVTKSFAFPYAPAMKSGKLEVEGSASKGTKAKVTPRMEVAVGVITTSKLVKPVYAAAFSGHGYNNQEEVIPVVIPDFIFEQGRSVLRTSEIKSDKGKQLDAFIASKNITRTVTITGTHSPEGADRINSRLANERAAAIEKFYRQQMKKYDYKGMADSISFIQKPVIDDWNEFKNALSAYEGISSEEKAEYLNIINAGGAFEATEKQLKKLKTYKKVFKDVYPGLRTAKTEILTIKDKKTDAEIAVLAKQITQGSASADALSFEELMYSATLTPSLEEKAAIYEAATKKGTFWNAHNNLGATYLAQAVENPANANALADKAAAQLDIAAKLNAAPEVHANLASVQMIKGNAYAAYSHATKALGAGLSGDNAAGLNGVKGAAEIVMAKYADAVRSESSAADNADNLFNKGLAQVLNKDYQNALTSFSQATSKNSNLAIAYYGAAVASARLGNADGVVSNLSNAVKADPSLKEAALGDLEFAKFATSEAFRNALK
ncbi:MAG: tetratricopeptide repeat protein [Cyclobacteriaceae bacterium]|nr:tetratricopeptide repeat protein [Cyclobacteriaceae bacterium]